MKARIAGDRIKKNKNGIKLSVGMIVKDEHRYLPDCLDGLKPLLLATGGELVIVDTGSSDDTVLIAKRYTDKVYNFTWNGSFADARNFGLQKTVGDWFMFVDADEHFVNIAGIVKFINTAPLDGDIMSAAYTLRNIKSADDNDYYDHRTTRIYRRFNGIKFDYSIHEGIMPPDDTTVCIIEDALCIHYGYSTAQMPGQTQAKSSRNLSALKIAMDKEPNSLHYIVHYVRELVSADKHEDIIDNCRKGLSLPHNEHERCLLYNFLISTLIVCERIEEARTAADEYFSGKKMPLTSDLDITFNIANAELTSNNFEEAKKLFISFLNLYKQYEDGRLRTADIVFNPQATACCEAYCDALTRTALMQLRTGETVSAKKSLDTARTSLPNCRIWNGKVPGLYGLCAYCEELDDYSEFAEFYKQVLGTEKGIQIQQKLLQFELYVQYKGDRPETRVLIANSFCTIFKKPQNAFILCQHIISGKNLSAINEIVHLDRSQLSAVMPDIIYFMLQLKSSLSDIINMLTDFTTIYETVTASAKKYDDFGKMVLDYFSSGADFTTARELVVAATLQLNAILSGYLTAKDSNALFVFYISEQTALLHAIYSPEILNEEDVVLLSPEYRFAYYMELADGAKQGNNSIAYVKNLKLALAAMPVFASCIGDLLSQLIEDLL